MNTNFNPTLFNDDSYVIPAEGDTCICPHCKSPSVLIGGKISNGGWIGELWQKVTLRCPKCGDRSRDVEVDWVSKEDLLVCAFGY